MLLDDNNLTLNIWKINLEEIVVEVIKVHASSTIHIVPPITGEVLLMKHGAIGTNKTVLN